MEKSNREMRKEVNDNMITPDKVSNGIVKIDGSKIIAYEINRIDFLRNIKNITSPELKKIQHRIKDELLLRKRTKTINPRFL